MNKKMCLVSILILIICFCVTVGFIEKTSDNVIQENDKKTGQENYNKVEYTADPIEPKTIRSEIQSETPTSDKVLNEAVESVASLELSNKDELVKAEISNHIDTAIEFRYSKQEKIQSREFNLSFSGVEEFQQKKELISYKNEFEDEFLYKADTGKLFLARINSNIVQKTEKSIDLNIAQKTAEEYVIKNYADNEMILSQFQEVGEGYFFEYSKFLFEYKTNATFEIIVSFDGDIVYIRDSADLLDNVAENIEEALIEQRHREVADKCAEEGAEIKKVSLLIENNKIYLVSTISYNSTGVTIELISDLQTTD